MEDLITAAEAAEMLSITQKHVHNLCRRGILASVTDSKPMKFRRNEVAAVASLRFKKLDMETVANMALRALVLAKSNEHRLDEVRSLLGMQGKVLSTEENEVVSLFTQFEDYILDPPIPAEEVRRLALIILSINEDYLRAVEIHTATEEPWKPFMTLGLLLSDQTPRSDFSANKDLESAYAYLELARRHLLQISYFYVRNKAGQRAAMLKFPLVEGGVDEAIIGLAFKN